MIRFPFARAFKERFPAPPVRRLTPYYLRDVLRGLLACQVLMILAVCGLLFASPAVAADGTLQPLNVNPVVVLVGLLFSTLAGSASLLRQIIRELDALQGRPLPRPWLLCSGHMLGAWFAGGLGYFISKENDLTPWATLAAVSIFSFVGVPAVEWVIDKLAPGARSKLERP
jgi:hypothetical protein